MKYNVQRWSEQALLIFAGESVTGGVLRSSESRAWGSDFLCSALHNVKHHYPQRGSKDLCSHTEGGLRVEAMGGARCGHVQSALVVLLSLLSSSLRSVPYLTLSVLILTEQRCTA